MLKRMSYGLYHRFSSSAYWMRRRLTKAGWVVLTGVWLTAALGVDTSLSVAYQAFIFLFLLLFSAVLLSRISCPRFSARRLLPRFATVDVPLRYRLVFRNGTRRKQQGLTVVDQFEDPRPTPEEFRALKEPGEEQRNWFDRALGYYRWVWIISKKQIARASEALIPAVAPNGSIEVEVELTPLRRGILHFRGMTAAAPDPTGLFRSLRELPLPGSLVVLPRRYPMPRLPLPGEMKYQPGGVALAGSVGESEEFVSLRDYRPGDPLRRIHWKSWAKTGQPIVKEFHEEFFVRHALILDTFAEGAFSDIFEDAVSVAASFACTVETQDALLDLMFIGPQAYRFTSGRGLAHTEQMLEILASVTVCQDQSFSALSDLVTEQVASVSGCVCVLVRWDEERKELIETLNALAVPVSVFLIVEPGRAGTFDPGPMKGAPDAFYVLETGKIAEGLSRL